MASRLQQFEFAVDDSAVVTIPLPIESYDAPVVVEFEITGDGVVGICDLGNDEGEADGAFAATPDAGKPYPYIRLDASDGRRPMVLPHNTRFLSFLNLEAETATVKVVVLVGADDRIGIGGDGGYGVYLPLDGSLPMTGDLDMGAHAILCSTMRLRSAGTFSLWSDVNSRGGTMFAGQSAAITIGKAGEKIAFAGSVEVQEDVEVLGGTLFNDMDTFAPLTGSCAQRITTSTAALIGAQIKDGGYVQWGGNVWNAAGAVSIFGAGMRQAHTIDTINGAGVPLTYHWEIGDSSGVEKWRIAQDGKVTMAGALAMGANKITGLANGAAADDAAAFGQIPVVGTIAAQNANAVAITGGTIAGLTGLAIRDTSAAFDVTIAAISTTALTAGRTLTLDMNNVANTLKFTATTVATVPSGTVTLASTANLASYLPLAGGTMTGDIVLRNAATALKSGDYTMQFQSGLVSTADADTGYRFDLLTPGLGAAGADLHTAWTDSTVNMMTLGLSTLNTVKGATLTVNRNGIGAASTAFDQNRAGLILVNTTAATAGVPVQVSAALVLQGNAYNSVTTLSETQTIREYVIPKSAAGATGFLWRKEVSLNGAAYAPIAMVDYTLNNSAQGYSALYSNTTGSNNSAQGAYALYSNTTGSYNSAQGYGALYSNTTGSYNSAQGYSALYLNTTGSNNSAQGYGALYSNTTGSNNSAQGYYALLATTGSNNAALGYYAGKYETGSNKVFIDTIDRTTEALGRTNSLIYGVTNATVANQTLALNAAVTSPVSFTASLPNLAANTVNGFLLRNTTVALVGAKLQVSSALNFEGHAWDDDDVVSDGHYCQQHLLVSSGNTTASRIAFLFKKAANEAGGAYAEQFGITNLGRVKTIAGNESTGAGTALLGAANCPAGTVGNPNTWLTFEKSDGTLLYVPAWA